MSVTVVLHIVCSCGCGYFNEDWKVHEDSREVFTCLNCKKELSSKSVITAKRALKLKKLCQNMKI